MAINFTSSVAIFCTRLAISYSPSSRHCADTFFTHSMTISWLRVRVVNDFTNTKISWTSVADPHHFAEFEILFTDPDPNLNLANFLTHPTPPPSPLLSPPSLLLPHYSSFTPSSLLPHHSSLTPSSLLPHNSSLLPHTFISPPSLLFPPPSHLHLSFLIPLAPLTLCPCSLISNPLFHVSYPSP